MQVALCDTLDLGIVHQLPMAPGVVAFHNKRMIRSPLLDLRRVDDGRTIREQLGTLPRCDQTDATYGILHGLGDDDEGEYPAYCLNEPLGEISAEERARLGDRLRFNEGFVAVYATHGLSAEDYFMLGINDCWRTELTEPHVLVYDYDVHVAVALDGLRVLKGPVLGEGRSGEHGLGQRPLQSAQNLIAKNREQMLADFRAIEWLKQRRSGKSYRLNEEGAFEYESDFSLDPVRWY